MAIRLKHRSATGETRFWTVREILQGKPVDRPSHPMLVHFPIALSITALVIDVASRIGDHSTAPQAATWLIGGALLGFAAAAVTGIAERATMARDSRIQRLATRHMLVQFGAAAVFLVDFAIRWSDRFDARPSFWWIALDLVGVLVMGVGADIGGRVVFKVGYRGLGGE